ncbi:MAG: hypothetical protein ACRCS3_07935 [Paracoccaceae bacterium]
MNAPRHIMPPPERKPYVHPGVSMAELAARENAAMQRIGTGASSSGVRYVQPSGYVGRRTPDTQNAVMAQLQSGPQTARAIAAAIGRTDDAVKSALAKLKDKEMVRQHSKNGPLFIWAITETETQE